MKKLSKVISSLKRNDFLLWLLQPYFFLRFRQLSRRDPRINANKVYRQFFNKNINWEHPKNLIEKIYWLQLFTDTSLWTLCADKFRMREYVKKKGLEMLLPHNYGHWQNANEIDYNKLPNGFVLKTTNGCGQVFIVKNKEDLDIKSTNKLLNQWMKIKYGFTDAQIHYSRIKPCIIAEELLIGSQNPQSPFLTDYKVWCFHGKPECVLVVYDRDKSSQHGYRLAVYDLNWINISNKVLIKGPHFGGVDLPRPTTLSTMFDVAKKLSQDFAEVRIDFYEINGRLYIGEMTFSTGYGYFSKEYYEYLGSKIDLNRVEKIKGINRPPHL